MNTRVSTHNYIECEKNRRFQCEKTQNLKKSGKFSWEFFLGGGIFWNEQNVKKMSDSWLVKIYNDKYKW